MDQDFLLSPWLVGDIKALEDVQIQAVKMVSGLKSKDYHERLAELGMTTLEERRREMDMVQTQCCGTGTGTVGTVTF